MLINKLYALTTFVFEFGVADGPLYWIEDVPLFRSVSITNPIDADTILPCNLLALPLINCGTLVTLIEPVLFGNKFGITDVPFSMIFNTIPNKLPTLLISVREPLSPVDTSFVPLTLIDADVFPINVGIEPVPFVIMFFTLPYEELTLPVNDVTFCEPSPNDWVTDVIWSGVGIWLLNP